MATRAIPKAAFSSTAKQWFELTKTTVESDDDGDALEELDRLILGHRPTSDLEIIVLVDVVIEALRSGGRVDGLEISALLNVRDRVLKDSAEKGLVDAYLALQVQWPAVEQRRAASG